MNRIFSRLICILLVCFYSFTFTARSYSETSISEHLQKFYYDGNKWGEAYQYLAKYIQETPRAYEGYLEFAKLGLLIGMDLEDVEYMVLNANDLNPEDRDVQAYMGYFSAMRGEKDSAIDFFDKAWGDGDGSTSEIARLYAEALIGMGEADKAVGVCDKSFLLFGNLDYLVLLKYYAMVLQGKGAEGAQMLLDMPDDRYGYFNNVATDYFARTGDFTRVDSIIEANARSGKAGCWRAMTKLAVRQIQKKEFDKAYQGTGKIYKNNGCLYSSLPYYPFNYSLPYLLELYLGTEHFDPRHFAYYILGNLLDEDKYRNEAIYQALKDIPHSPYIHALMLFRTGYEDEAAKYYYDGEFKMPLNPLEGPSELGLFNQRSMDTLQMISQHVEQSLDKVDLECLPDEIDNGTYMGRYDRDSENIELLRYMKGGTERRPKCHVILYKVSDTLKKTKVIKIQEFVPLKFDEEKVFMETFFYEPLPSFMGRFGIDEIE